MTQERIQTRYRLAGTFTTQAEREQAIALAIEHNKQDFFPLLERLVDVGDSRVRLSQQNPLRVLGVELDGADTGGSARLSYESNFAEGCRLIDEYDQHQTSVAFTLDGDQLVFDLELPIEWNFNN
ncbi:hypothetical protein P5G63_13670 [Aeromonas salmonicida]|uniref:hypothetical protein n=1 Tax=Aeromonas salmonicida TaxID=645 RepID=UPI00223F6C20|nr:hypothetical protein [Aeromonas salmonicida]MDF8329480.1 hypothetical protein [Aeromonas salmonicida]